MKNYLVSLVIPFYSLFSSFSFSIPKRNVHLFYTKLNNIPKSIELMVPKKNFIKNNGTDNRFNKEEKDELKELRDLNLIKQNFEKKKILEYLQNNNTCIESKISLIEAYSFLFDKEKGLKRDFDEFLCS